MPLQNRVTPTGDLIADPAQGLFLGNRGGRIHDPATRTLGRARWASRTWICCVLVFRERRRTVWGHSYTELFFCDEPTALAAGHRPCVECRRRDAHAWRAAAAGVLGLGAVPLFPDMDRRLDAERRVGHSKRLHPMPAESLPDGAMIQRADGVCLALRGGRALPWSPAGYGMALPRPAGTVAVLTPPTSLAALAGGYRPSWHPSAGTDPQS
jgi:hypothetical protein